jgi:hypothetical protein
MFRRILVLFFFAGIAISACDFNLQGTPFATQPACVPPKTGDPAPDKDEHCAAISGARAIRVCLNRCKPVATEGEPCTNDLCADGGAVCDAQLACLPDGKCGPHQKSACDVNKSAIENACVAGTYCKLLGPGACPGTDVSSPFTWCAGFVLEGDECDGDFDASKPMPGVCSPCEPGTTCVKALGASKGECRRECDPSNPSALCPCEGFRCIQNNATAPSGSYCDQCAATNLACADSSDGNAPCCDPSAKCSPSTSNVCCRPSGTDCTSSGQCCGGANATGTCNNGACALSCSSGWADCNKVAGDGCEVDRQKSPTNCGACGNKCSTPAGGKAICVAGACQADCPSGLTLCGNVCVNLKTDPGHCGSCATACTGAPVGGTATCTNGSCKKACSSGLDLCDNACVNLDTDQNHCGSCSTACIPGSGGCKKGNCCAQWGTSCGGTVSCCPGTSCMPVPALGGDLRCCHGTDNETMTCD